MIEENELSSYAWLNFKQKGTDSTVDFLPGPAANGSNGSFSHKIINGAELNKSII